MLLFRGLEGPGENEATQCGDSENGNTLHDPYPFRFREWVVANRLPRGGAAAFRPLVPESAAARESESLHWRRSNSRRILSGSKSLRENGFGTTPRRTGRTPEASSEPRIERWTDHRSVRGA